MNERHPHSPIFSDTPTTYTAPYSGDTWRTDVLSAVDWRGNRFALGDTVMYCIGAGRGQMMALGEVKAIRHRTERVGRDREIERDVIEVQVLTKMTSGHWGNEARSKPAWVNPMNITVLVDVLNVEYCEANARKGTGTGACDRPLDKHGNCDRAGSHI